MLILRLSKREDQALIPISTILKFSAQAGYSYSASEVLRGICSAGILLMINVRGSYTRDIINDKC